MMRFHIFITWLVVVGSAVAANAGFEITSFSLFNLVRDSSGPSSFQDVDRITDILNPLQQSSIAQLGNNFASSTYDFSWIEDVGIGDFTTSFSHAMRHSPRISTVTGISMFIETDVELIVSLDGSTDYGHTPGDETQFLFGATIREINTQITFFGSAMEGGNADFLPASGTLTFGGQVVLPPNGTYLFSTTLDADNFDEDNAGIYDANGFANISIRPVPEPQALWLWLPTLVLLRRCGR